MKTIFSILFFLIYSTVFSQEIMDQKLLPDSVIHEYQLNEKQAAAWNKIKSSWVENDYKAILKENKIKLGCGGISNNECESIYVDVVLKINEKRKLEYYKLINGKKCGEPISKPLEIQLMKMFFKKEFPQELRNIKFETRLGSVLKC